MTRRVKVELFGDRFFKDLNSSAGIDLENIVYYKDETHYFVMTAKKHSLLYKGVLLQVSDYYTPTYRELLLLSVRPSVCLSVSPSVRRIRGE